jgi:hypothetical protein
MKGGINTIRIARKTVKKIICPSGRAKKPSVTGHGLRAIISYTKDRTSQGKRIGIFSFKLDIINELFFISVWNTSLYIGKAKYHIVER